MCVKSLNRVTFVAMFSCTASCKIVADGVFMQFWLFIVVVPINTDADNITLREDEVPGASLRGRDVTSLKIPELKRWLQCRI